MDEYIRVPFAGGWAQARPPAGAVVQVLEPADLPSPPEEDVMSHALDAADASLSFFDRPPSRTQPLTIVVNDATRPTPSGRVLSHLVQKGLLPSHPAPGTVRILVATGSHRSGGRGDAERILDGALSPAWLENIQWHDARSDAEHTSVGTTSRGTPVAVDRRVPESGSLLLINSVEPHYFAGYTGGRKSLMPGVCAYRTIQANHRLALDPAADVLRLAGNPVHEDAEEAVSLMPLPNLLSLQLVLDRRQQICFMAIGALRATFAAAVSESDRRYVRAVSQPCDIVISAAAPPTDYDLYQSQKAVDNAARAVRDGGTLILVSTCRNGIGDRTCFDLLSSCSAPSDVRRRVADEYVLGYHKAARLAIAAERIHLFSVTRLPDPQMRAVFFEPFADLQSALDRAAANTGPNPYIAVLPDGCVTVPRVESPRRQP